VNESGFKKAQDPALFQGMDWETKWIEDMVFCLLKP
jgi:hypothetical protein